MAGMCSSRLVEPPNAAWTTIALRTAASVRMSRVVMPRVVQRAPARGPSARGQVEPDRLAGRGEGRVRQRQPSASPTTCDVAAVPRNWQPPPGEAQARQPSSAASSSVISPCAKRAPIDWTLPASSPARRRQRHAAGHQHAGQVVRCRPAPSSSPAGPCRRWRRPSRPRRVGSERISRPKHHGRVVAIRQAVEHAGVPCVRPSHGSVTNAGERDAARAASAPRPPPAPAGRLPSARCGSRARSACRRRRACRPAC